MLRRNLAVFPSTSDQQSGDEGSLEAMGVEHLSARTKSDFELKVHASLIALACTNMNWQSRLILA
jgi:hypothetical protein